VVKGKGMAPLDGSSTDKGRLSRKGKEPLDSSSPPPPPVALVSADGDGFMEDAHRYA
jgi:hypothetical protein